MQAVNGTEAEDLLDGVAIIGMAARFPGAADVDAYWRNQVEGISAVTRLSDEALREAGFSPADLADPRLVRAFGALDGIADFDARFFGFPPARAQGLDPQQRLLLEVAWHAMEHAGYAPGTAKGAVGTYLSITQSGYRPEAQNDLAESFFDLTSRDKDYAASRVAYKLDLTGPSMMIQSASSGSLAAIHAAVEGLLSGQCDLAIAGGCSITLPQGAYRHAAGLMLSATGTCRAFDAAADGTVPGNGLGIVVLKPLAKAVLDGDTIYAVIRGSALNNDGAQKTDYLAPSVQGQARVVGEALAAAGVAPETIGYIETHGTGTLIGDPIEIRALAQIFRSTAGDRRCAIGSVKPGIGHLHVASGVAGLIRAALAVHHGLMPPTLNFASANPETDLGSTPFYVNTTLSPWPGQGPRRAGVSAFGLGGTNVHVVLEQAPPARPRTARIPLPLPLILSAKTPRALDIAAANLTRHLRTTPSLDLRDVAWTLAVGRQHFDHRLAVLCSDTVGAIAALQQAGTSLEADGAMAAAARLWRDGGIVDWADLFAGTGARRVALPQYAFEAVRHWSQAANERQAVISQAEPVDRAAEVLPWLQSFVAEILRQPPAELDPDANYEAFGIDSLLVNTITQALQQRYTSLRATALFEYNTLRRLAGHLAASEANSDKTPRPAGVVAEGIAIIGIAGRYPGATDLDQFWCNLRAGRNSISEVPADRWDWTKHVDSERRDRSYTRWGGFIEDADKFDSLFFGISPREANLLDPQQRLFLEIAWAAIENAGYTRQGLKTSAAAIGGDVGVFAGVMNNAYRLLGMKAVDAGHLVQSNHWSIPNRVSYLFDFTGPSLAVDTACSASLAAVHLACESLRREECGVALAGGVNLILHPQQPLELSRAGMLSKGPRNSAFGEAGDGFVQGEGVGVVILKPLAAAILDGDRIHAVIRGSAMNAGGKTSGFTVPNPHAQAAVVEAALRQADVMLDNVGYVECHGTGTSLGDPIEIAGLTEAFRRAGRSATPCSIGSVKSNIGHLEAAAGIAGLTKVVLQLAAEELVPSLHAFPPNSRVEFGVFQVQKDVGAWSLPTGGPRCAGISSFGAGGTNVHVVLEQAPVLAASTLATGPWLVPLSARDPERLAVLLATLRDRLMAGPVNIADLAFTLALGREAMEARAVFVVTDQADLIRVLAQRSAARPASDVSAMADRWMAGATIDWAPLFAGQRRRRLALPTYPFLRERHWLPDTKPCEAEAPGLLGELIPTLAAGARWRVPIDATSAMLSGHRVEGVPTLPGVAMIALATEAMGRLGRGTAIGIRRLTWLRPLTAEGGSAECTLHEETDGLLNLELTRAGMVHSTATLGTPSEGMAGIPTALAAGSETGEVLYARLAARGLDYGAGFRTIETFSVAGAEAIATARSSDIFGPGVLNPGLLDGALQLTAALLDDGGLILPFAVEAVDVLAPPPGQCRFYARRLKGDGGLLRFDVVIADMDGRACVVFRELTGRPRADAQLSNVAAPATTPARSILARLFTKGQSREEVVSVPVGIPPFYKPIWLAEPMSGPTPPLRENIQILAVEGDALTSALVAALPTARLVTEIDDAADEVIFACTETADSVERLFQLIQSCATPLSLTLVAKARDEGLTPWVAAAMGLARVAGHERPSWTVRCLAVADPADIPLALTNAGDALGREVIFRGGRRFVRGLQPATSSVHRPAFRRGGVYLILGGVGGIGLELATYLVTRHGARVALLGRSMPDAIRQARIDTLAGQAAFFQADACNLADMRHAIAAVRARFGAITGAIHSAIVMEDQAIAKMSGLSFHAALDVKTLGTMNLVAALAGEKLDWLALFSSANSFAANAGQANYVAGCAFKDAYAVEAAAHLGCPVRVINWGFWGEVGRVADPVYRERLARRGVHSIATAEGIAALEQILGSDLGQVLVLKAEDRVLRDLGVVTAAAAEDVVTVALAEHAALDDLTRRWVALWFAENPAAETALAPRHRALGAALANLRARARRPGPALIAGEEAAFVVAHPDLASHVALLRQCIDHYGPVLRGEMLATEVLFPGSSMALVEGIYRGDRLTTHCNGQVAEAVSRVVAARRGRPVRVLEVGAGTGGTSDGVLAALSASGADVTYHYTDISRAFALHGERRFSARYPFVTFGVLDLGRDLLSQGYKPAGFDVVIGANVVHVTADLDVSTARLNGLLAPGGALVLYEMTALTDFGTATFGLLDGWWTFTDARLPHAPLLDAPSWSRLLRAAGFADVALHGIGGTTPETYRHTVIVATNPVDRAPAPLPRLTEPAAAIAAPSSDALVEAIRAVVAETLQMRPAQLLDNRNFADYGADSIISVDLIAALNGRFAITLKPTILFSHPTVERLAVHLAEHHGLSMGSTVVPPTLAAHASAWADDVAVIGMAGRFPGADTIDAFWTNIVGGVDSVGPVPRSRWDHAAIYDPSPSVAGKTQCPAGGFLEGIDLFDPLFFNLSPAEAAAMDPQQRLFLQEAWHALEDAGYAGPHPALARCGVFVGTVAGDYDELLRRSGRAPDAHSFMGNAASMLAGRIAYRLDLQGPCLSIDTACSSSLVAVQLACESLLRGESDLALAGGVAILTTSDFYLAASNAGMLSPSGRCRTLDAAADGFVPGEAAAVVILKRRADADRDGDRILALIKGAATNQDGASNGITAPNGAAQTALERTVYDRFAIDPATLGYVELHGTGTRLGDPIEVDALRAAFAGRSAGCAIGSVKANIGHTMPAAGVAGLIKLVLALRHRIIPPAVHFHRANDHLSLHEGPFLVPETARPWVAAEGPRRGAVSSFGFSGTNAHLVLEEAPPARPASAPPRGPLLAVFSAQTEAALGRVLNQMLLWLVEDDGRTPIVDICATLARGRSPLVCRAAFIVADAAGLAAALRDPHAGPSAAARGVTDIRAAYLAGDAVSWERFYPNGTFTRAALPTYPFERRSCWPAPVVLAATPTRERLGKGTLALFDAVIRDLGAIQ